MSAELMDFPRYIYHIDKAEIFMKKEKFVIDRIENGVIVLLSCKDDTELLVRADEHPAVFHENDIVYVSFEDGEVKEIASDNTETKKKKNEIKKRFRSLFDKK